MSRKTSFGIPIAEPPGQAPTVDRLLDAALRASRAGRHQEAAELCGRALRARPDSHVAVQILGVSHYQSGDVGGALRCFEKAIDIDPQNADGYNNLGNVLAEIGRYDEAAEHLARAVELNPESSHAHSNLGRVLGELGRFDEALAEVQSACRHNPAMPEAYINFGKLLMDVGLTEEGLGMFEKALEIDPCRTDAHSNYLMCLQYSGRRTAQELLDAARAWAESHAPEPLALPPCPRKEGVRLRIGYVSGDLRAHPVGYTLEELLPNHDRDRFEVYAYANLVVEDPISADLRAAVDGWRVIAGLNDDAAARLIREDGIDVLIDLAGHTARNRLGVFARKPAPVQASWLGYFATTGMPQMDYILRDRVQIPESEEPHYVERVAVLESGLYCFAPPHEPVEVGASPALRKGWVTFGSFNNLSKMNDQVARLWSAVLKAVPGSKLYVNRSPLRSEIGRQVVSEAFAKHGIQEDRLILTATKGREAYLHSYGEVDVVLDTFPFNGATTTYEALWMGVPVVTRTSDRMVGHFGESILQGVGLTEWVAHDDDAFVAMASSLAANPSALAVIRAGLRDRFLASPLCSGRSFVRSFEDALVRLWEARQ